MSWFVDKLGPSPTPIMPALNSPTVTPNPAPQAPRFARDQQQPAGKSAAPKGKGKAAPAPAPEPEKKKKKGWF